MPPAILEQAHCIHRLGLGYPHHGREGLELIGSAPPPAAEQVVRYRDSLPGISIQEDTSAPFYRSCLRCRRRDFSAIHLHHRLPARIPPLPSTPPAFDTTCRRRLPPQVHCFCYLLELLPPYRHHHPFSLDSCRCFTVAEYHLPCRWYRSTCGFLPATVHSAVHHRLTVSPLPAFACDQG